MDVEALVVRDGDRVAASGRLVRNPDGDWFEPALPRTLIGGVERQVAAPWRGAVRITGVNFDALGNRFEHDGAVEGYASVTGIWSHDQFRAIRQTTAENTLIVIRAGTRRHARPRLEAGRTWTGDVAPGDAASITWTTTSATWLTPAPQSR